MSVALHEAYVRLIASEAFDGSHVSIDRSRHGELVQVLPDWVGQDGLRLALDLARELELALTLTKDGLRLEPHTGDFLQRVEAVKQAIRDYDEGDGEP
jgi:hypothetical protein